MQFFVELVCPSHHLRLEPLNLLFERLIVLDLDLRIVMSGKFLAWCVEPQVVGPKVPHYKIQPWETFGCLEDLRLEFRVIEDYAGLLDEEVDVCELKFFEPSLPLALNLFFAIDLLYLPVAFLLH